MAASVVAWGSLKIAAKAAAHCAVLVGNKSAKDFLTNARVFANRLAE